MNARAHLLGFVRVLLLASLVVGLIGLFRLGRQFPAAAATPGLLVPFLKPVLALALEAGALVALSASVLGARAPAPASFVQRLRALAVPLAMASGIWALAAVLPRGTERPGSLANDLIARAQAGCDDAVSSVAVPLLGLEVRCAEPRRIEGPMPGVAAVQLVMRELSFSDDLRRVRIAGLELKAERALRVHLKAGTAQIAGLAPWTRSPQLPTLTRLFVLFGMGAWLALASCLWWHAAGEPAEARVESSQRWRRWLLRGRRALLLALPGAAAAGVVIALDQQRATLALYTLAAAAGLVALLGLRLIARYAPNWFSSLGNS